MVRGTTQGITDKEEEEEGDVGGSGGDREIPGEGDIVFQKTEYAVKKNKYTVEGASRDKWVTNKGMTT